MKLNLILLSAFLVFTTSACKKDLVDTSQNEILDVTKLDGFNQAISKGVSMVFFHASWCEKCEEQRPAVEALSVDEDYEEVNFIEVEYEDSKEIVEAYGVPGFPTIYIFSEGTKVEEFIGKGHSEAQLKAGLDKYL